MMRVREITIAALLTILLIGCDADPTIATIGNEQVKLQEFETTYAKSNGGWDSCAHSSLQERQKFLDLMVSFKLKVLDAKNHGLLQDSAVQSELASYRSSIAQSYILEQEIIQPGVKLMLQRKKEMVRASHIFFRLTPEMTPADTAKLYKRAQEAIAALATQPFDSVVAHMSEDLQSRRTSGEIGYFTGGRMVPEFEDAAYGLKVGEYTKVPVRTRYGYHVIKVLDRQPNAGSVHLSHILWRFANDHHDTVNVHDSVYFVYHQIKNGMKFEDAAKKYSQDSRSAGLGGDIGTYDRDRMPTQIGEKVFNVDSGTVVEPVRLAYGYHIFKITGKQPLPPDSMLLDDIKKTYQDVRYEYDRKNFVQRLKQQYPLQYDSAAIHLLIATVDSNKTPSFPDWSDTLTRGNRSTVLMICGDKKLNIENFIEKVTAVADQQNMKFTPANVWNLLHKFSDDLVIAEYAGHAEQRYPALVSLLKEYQDGVLLYRIEQDEVWKKIAANDSVLKIYYDQHKENYRWPKRVNFAEIYVSTDSAAKAASWQLQYGEKFSDVAKRITVRPGYSEKGGEWGWQTFDANELALHASTMAVDSITPPFRYETGWSILKVLGYDNPRIKTFDEATAEVSTGYQEQASKQREEEWLASLKTQYPVVMHPEVLPEAFKGKKIEVQ
ncbi:MAG TPA: peptidylprolyl isomerase [Bacteroidota bacterium]|nr:peptidylprolyl isomerase [Bacteroidota bacterium]